MDNFLFYYLLTKHKVKLSSRVINFTIESVDDPTNLPYGMVIAHILEAHYILLSNYPYLTVTKCYNSGAFASMGYVSMDDMWVKKQEGEAEVVPRVSKPKSVSPSLVCL